MTYIKQSEELKLKNSAELEAVELIKKLWQSRFVIGFVTFIFFASASIYLLIADNVYEARALFTAPTAGQVEIYNQGRAEAEFKELKVEDIYQVFLRNLYSERLMNTFIQDVYFPALKEKLSGLTRREIKERFQKSMSIRQVDPRRDSQLYELRMRSSDPVTAKKWTDLYIEMAATLSKKEIQASLEAERKVRADSIRLHISALRGRAEAERHDEIQQKEEALRVAVAAGLESSAGVVPAKVEGREFDSSLLYLSGAKVLRQQISQLKARVNNDPYIENLRKLNMQLNLLDGVKIDDSKVELVTFDEEADVPTKPVQPKKILILFFSLIVGLGGGSMFALARKK